MENREIKFRGKATCSDKWAYGCYVECDGGFYIIVKLAGHEGDVSKIQVYRETVGQYTGLKDKDGKEIYEGDVVRWGILLKGEEVFFEEGGFTIKAVDDPYWEGCEVIGNVHQNPELLEKK